MALAFAGDAKDKGDGGLPQLNVETYTAQVFWLVIFFMSLYVIFSRNILPAISATIQNRTQHINDDRETAHRLTEEAESAQKSYEEKLDQAKQQAAQLIKDAENDILDHHQKSWADFRQKALDEEQKLVADVHKAKKEALDDMNLIAAEIAQEAAVKIVGINMDIESAKSIVKSLSGKVKAA